MSAQRLARTLLAVGQACPMSVYHLAMRADTLSGLDSQSITAIL